MKGTVYLIHLSEPYITAKGRQISHYIGWAKNLVKRLAHHRAGTGAKFLRAVNERGIQYEVAKVWEEETKDFERLLKNRKNAKCFCPLCRGRPEQKFGAVTEWLITLRQSFNHLFTHFLNFISL